MKHTKKIFGLLCALIMLLSLSSAVFAADNGTITVNGTSVGKDYNIYKIFDLTMDGSAIAYTIDEDWVSFFIGGSGASYLSTTPITDANQLTYNSTTYYMNILTEADAAAFAQAALEFIATKTPDSTQTATDTSVLFSGLPLGYYLVYPEGAATIADDYASLCSLTSTVPDATVVVKAEYPDIDKNILDENNEVKITNGSVGEVIQYALNGTVPDMTGYTSYTYQIQDTMGQGLTFNDDVVITINDIIIPTTAYAVNQASDGTNNVITIEISDFYATYKDNANEDITITYSAVINEHAITDVTAETNTAKLIYSSDPENTTTTDETPTVTTKVYTTNITLLKVDAADITNSLTGLNLVLQGTLAL
ncbi:MAG: isopeptide-forming domain-containing fimbrial protein [Lachnospiraceae bacterium]